MIVDIEKVIVKDRIRKDFGDIQELADDIKMNGLINPPVVNKNYELLAGERRLRACKELGWNQVEVRMMDTRDAEHELNVEISENDVRKGFTKSERVDYMKRLLRIEQAKAKERQNLGEKSREGGRSDEKTAEQFGVSSNTMRKEISIVENKDLLDPSDFAEWDEGKLSTNKAFQKVKASLEQAKRQHIIDSERIKILEKQEPEVIEKEIIKEVVPDDYEETKKRLKALKADHERVSNERKQYLEEWNEAKERVRELEDREGIYEAQAKLERESQYLEVQINSFIRQAGGYVWITDKLDELPEKQRENVIKAIKNINAWSQQMLMNIGGNLNVK
jgi:ParB family chromosome partitioning protein